MVNKSTNGKKWARFLSNGALALIGGLVLATLACLQAPPKQLANVYRGVERTQFLDRDGQPLNISYQNRWNLFNQVALYQTPALLQQAFITAEDKNFYQHPGVDWLARANALKAWITHGKAHRGASTITEQVVRLIHPRPRNLWSRWLEGWEALWLESRASKAEILEFYLNQVPYAAQRRGVAQAARYYFNRDLVTLTPKEMLALVVLVRAPGRWDPYQNPTRLEGAIERLAGQLQAQGIIDNAAAQAIAQQTLAFAQPAAPLSATHFIRYLQSDVIAQQSNPPAKLFTTLDSHLQNIAQKLLDQRIKSLSKDHVQNGALLIVDHRTGEILAWVVAGANSGSDTATPAGEINAVLTPRQPGSAMKPFLYAAALQKGWTAATLIEDEPKATPIRSGLHRFRNYSRIHYGMVTLREALGNSLNIPALQTIDYVTPKSYLRMLHQAGFNSLNESPSFYDEGLALGNGAVSLFELVQGFAMLAQGGQSQSLHGIPNMSPADSVQIFSPEITSIISDILSDPWARQWEFGADSVLRLPVQTAVKTGTSNDYHDAWTVGYDSRYVVGVWLGNLDNAPMNGVKGASGPALIARSIFAELNKDHKTAPLPLSSKLVKAVVCVPTLATMPTGAENCTQRSEYFLPGTEPKPQNTVRSASTAKPVIAQPSPGLMLAYNPRLPADLQAFEFRLNNVSDHTPVSWYLNEQLAAKTYGATYNWPLQRGKYKVYARIGNQMETDRIFFVVK